MGRITIISGPPFSGKTEHVISEISKLNPFDYTFIGSQGEFVKFVADLAAKKIGAVNRSAFKTIDQFAVENVKRQSSLVFADKPLKLIILSSVIEEMASKNLDIPEELKSEAEMINRKSTVEKLLSLLDDIKTYMKEEEFKEPESFRDMFIAGVFTRFKEKMSLMKLFDTYDAYKLIADEKVKVGGKYLFVDGFYDFTPVVGKFFKAVISSFDHVFITVTTGRIFESGTSTIMDVLKDFEFVEIRKSFLGQGIARGLFLEKGEGIKIHSFSKPSDEVEWICKKVKSLLLEGHSSNDFEIVVKSENSDYVKNIENKFEEYSINISYLGKKRLSGNTAVQKAMLPIRVASSGYPQDLLISMVMAGFGGEIGEFPLIYSKAHLERGPMKLSHKLRLEDWEKRLENFEKYLEKIKNIDDEEAEKIKLDAENLLRSIQKARATVKNLFEFLKKFENAKNSRDYSEIFEATIEKVKINAFEEDLKALEKFKALIWEMEGILNFAGMNEIDLKDYRYYLELQIKEAEYIPSFKYESVKISDVLTSRFNFKKIKIFVDFTEGNYPEFRPNYFYNAIEEERHFGNKMLKRLSDDKLDLYTAMAHAQEVYLTFPEASENGVGIIPSIYLEEIREKFEDISKPESYPYMSLQEGIISYSKWARWNGRDELIERNFGVSIAKARDMKVRDKMGLSYCRELSQKPISFYRYYTYDTCPLRYFFAYVMELSRPVVYDLDLNSIECGTVYHDSLKKLVEYGIENLKTLSEDEFISRVQSVSEDELSKISFFEPEIFEINLLKVSNVLVNYLKNVEFPVEIDGREKNLKAYKFYQTDHTECFSPRQFEFTFTSMEDATIDGLRFSGRIDRIDEVPSGLMIIDYKSRNGGKPDQLVLYSKICEKILDRPVIRAVFSVIEKAELENMLSKEKIDKNWEALKEKIMKFVEGVKDGNFVPQSCSKNCDSCDFNDICPVRWPDGTFKCSK